MQIRRSTGGALSFTTIFFMSALAFQRLVVARVFFLRDRQNSETLAGIFAARNIRRYFFLSLSCDSVANSRNSVEAIHSRGLFGKSLKMIHLRKQVTLHETSFTLIPTSCPFIFFPDWYVRGGGEKYNKIRRRASLFVPRLYSSTDFCVGICK